MNLKLAHRGPESDINVTPLIDVCLVLLVIFMIVTPLLKNPVELPPADTGAPAAEDRHELRITYAASGLLSVGAVVVTREQLLSELRQRHASRPNQELVLQADRRLSFGDVKDVLRACRDVGYDNVTLAVTPGTRG